MHSTARHSVRDVLFSRVKGLHDKIEEILFLTFNALTGRVPQAILPLSQQKIFFAHIKWAYKKVWIIYQNQCRETTPVVILHFQEIIVLASEFHCQTQLKRYSNRTSLWHGSLPGWWRGNGFGHTNPDNNTHCKNYPSQYVILYVTVLGRLQFWQKNT